MVLIRGTEGTIQGGAGIGGSPPGPGSPIKSHRAGNPAVAGVKVVVTAPLPYLMVLTFRALLKYDSPVT